MGLKFITLLGLTLTFNAFAEIDKIDSLNGVQLTSGKDDAIRSFRGEAEKIIPYPLAIVKKGVTNFVEKCNNNYRGKRKFTSKEVNCKYHNENFIESFIVTDLKPSALLKDRETSEYFLVGRMVYNRGSYGYYDLIRIKQGVNKKKQKTVMVSLKMLQDHEVKQLTKPKFQKDSAFDHSQSVFILTEISPTLTKIKYKYQADTDHWILNKEVAVPQVFASISRSINDLLRTVEESSSIQTREIASHQ